MAGSLCNSEDFGTACVKSVPNFRNSCIVKFKTDILIPKSADISCSIHASSERQKGSKKGDNIGLRNVREP